MARTKSDRITIKDVARDARVSPATVSRVLSNPDYEVSEELKKTVLESASRLNYVKGFHLRNVQFKSEIGVIVPNISNPFYTQALTGIEIIARDYNFGVVVCNSLRDKAREYDYLCQMYQRKVRAVILSSVSMSVEGLQEFMDHGMQIVLLDQAIQGAECAHVNFDMYRGATIAVKHLLDYGHKKIGFATSPITRWTRQQTYHGYKDALEQVGIAFDKSLIFTSQPEKEICAFGADFLCGVELGEKIAANLNGITAFLVVNSVTANGMIKALQEKGIRVPEDVSIVCMDEMPCNSTMKPALTSLCLPVFEAGKIAATIVISGMAQQKQNIMKMDVVPKLILRDSTCKI